MIQELYNVILENPYIGVCITDHKCNVICVNEVHSRITNISKEEFIGKNTAALVKANIFSASSSVEVARTKKEVSLHQVVSNGRHYDVKGIPVFDESGELQYIVSFLIDVSDLISTKGLVDNLREDIKEMESKYEKLLTTILGSSNVIYQSKVMEALIEKVKKCAGSDAPVLITGPSGSGKELIANLLYEGSDRKNKKFTRINCAAIPENLLESELFGYEKGTFTGALKDGKVGIFEECNGGTILLDEIGEMSLTLQAKLLRVLQEQKIRRIGGNHEIPISVRIIASTNANLKNKIKEKLFREDLFYRLNVIELRVPGLDERKEDVPILIHHFLNLFNTKYKCEKKFTADAIKFLYKMHYQGNVRELKNILERIVLQSDKAFISLEDVINILDLEQEQTVAVKEDSIKLEGSLKQMMENYEKAVLTECFSKYHNSTQVAKILKVDRTTISRKKEKYNL